MATAATIAHPPRKSPGTKRRRNRRSQRARSGAATRRRLPRPACSRRRPADPPGRARWPPESAWRTRKRRRWLPLP
ncbi:unnamed protein product, partial [Ectocarpus fasciculatus]